jgi:hypothetical protein
MFAAAGAQTFEQEDTPRIAESETDSDTEVFAPEEQAKTIRGRLSRVGVTASGLPAWCGYFGLSRPDGYILEGIPRSLDNEGMRRRPSDAANTSVTIHLLEFTRTSEAYLPQSRARKVKQYEEIQEHLTAAGWKSKLHIFQMGCRGYMPTETYKTLKSIGMASRAIDSVYNKLSRLVIRKAYSMVRLRRRLESGSQPFHERRRDRSKQNGTREQHARKPRQPPLARPSGQAALQEARRIQKLVAREHEKKGKRDRRE